MEEGKITYPSIRVVLEEGPIDGDLSVANAARVSFNKHVSTMGQSEEGLIRYLMRNHHGTPFEHNYFRFRIKVPIFVVREHHRHRVGHSYNEMSGRYVEMPGEFYLPDRDRIMVQVGKPGHYSMIGAEEWLKDEFIEDQIAISQMAWDIYQRRIRQGIEKGLARICLPLSLFTEYVWSCNARSLMHFMALRTAPAALQEIRTVAEECEWCFADRMPVTHRAWVEAGKVAP
jgi:thymidylate synthase (FAD)